MGIAPYIVNEWCDRAWHRGFRIDFIVGLCFGGVVALSTAALSQERVDVSAGAAIERGTRNVVEAIAEWLTPETPQVQMVETVEIVPICEELRLPLRACTPGEDTTFITWDDTTMAEIMQPEQFRFYGANGNLLVSLYLDGRIEFGPGYKPTDTAKQFWETLAANAPCRTSSRAAPPRY